MKASSGLHQEGWRTGYRDGWHSGYHYGRSQAVLNSIHEPSGQLYPLHVVFVGEGLFALNHGIETALARLVKKVTSVDPLMPGAAGYIASLEPDFVLVLNGIHAFPANEARMLRSLGIRTAVWFADDPYFSDASASVAPAYEFIFTHELGTVSFYRSLGCEHVYYLPLAADRSIFYPRPVTSATRADVCFIGTAFWNRVRFMDKIAPYLRNKKVIIAGGLWNRMKHYKRLRHSIRLAGIPFEQTPVYYSGAKIVINLHRAAVDSQHNQNSRQLNGYSVNPRTFEIAACSTLQLTDLRQDLTNFYIPGQQIETYGSEMELVEKIEHYLANEDQRSQIALRGLKRTLRDHTYRKRLTEMLHIIFGRSSG
ncbi:CgeB family protein [Paenibacillus senegalensis]|uniref:CgeB family protein n=1 Tax=Paenibacillus senegalensis TaxID=1465766 RepID=UPI000288719D|nr:glycosyltransferase [Paenibacillus senegalensis]